MEWLQTALERRGIEVTEELLAEVRKELPKHWIPKEEFNLKLEEIRELKEKAEARELEAAELKEQVGAKSQGEAEVLALEEKYKEEIFKLKESLRQVQFQAALELALSRSGARNVKALAALLDLEKIVLENGKLMGLEEQLQQIRAENDFLFFDPMEGAYATAMGQGAARTAVSGVEAAFYARNPALRP